MEPFRHVVERAAVGCGGIAVEQFRSDARLGCRLTPPAFKQYFGDLWERLERPVARVGETEPHSILQHIHRQNRRLIEALRGESAELVKPDDQDIRL